jgi:DNA-binding Lrp family transcriptional regulator
MFLSFMTLNEQEIAALDPIDRRLLTLLQQDCGLTNQALAEQAHLSPATCLRRVRRLIDLGVIERQVALLSPAVMARITGA